ncbi:MAG: hypothetical protein Q9197_003061 [Variospora fuerteventurae]
MASTTSSLDVLILTFNCGRNLVRPELLARHLSAAFPDPSPSPDIIVLSLQELAPLAYSFLGGSYLLPHLDRFRHAISLAGHKAFGEDAPRYTDVVTRNVGMTACMVFVQEEQKGKIQWVETGGVGVGLQEMGNKGAVGVRLGYTVPEGRIMELTFVAAHLAPMEDAVARRNKDWKNIVRGLVFAPVHSQQEVHNDTAAATTTTAESEPLLLVNDTSHHPPSGIYTPTSHLILAGDLNYRTSSTTPRPSCHLAFPQPTASPTDPHHYSHLLRSDQLTREREAGRTCHGLREAPITFPPTYKYSGKAQALAGEKADGAVVAGAGTGGWGWAKHRWPSWCDRVLFLDVPRRMVEMEVQKYTALPLMPTSDHQAVVLRLKVPLMAIPPATDESDDDEEDVRTRPPFAVDPRWRERRAAARRKEVVVGWLAYLFCTWEGNGILLTLLVVGGVLGGWTLIFM